MSIQRLGDQPGEQTLETGQAPQAIAACQQVAQHAIAQAAALTPPQGPPLAARLELSTHQQVREYLLTPRMQNFMAYSAIRHHLETGKKPPLVDIRAARSVTVYDGNLRVLNFFLAEWGMPQREDLMENIATATMRGHEDIVRHLVPLAAPLTQQEIGWLLTTAASADEVNILRFLLRDGREVSTDQLGEVVNVASEASRIDVLRCLFSHGGIIRAEDLGRALRSAVLNLLMNGGSHEVLEILLSEGRGVPGFDLALALELAAAAGNEPIVRFLLSSGRTLSDEHLAMAFDKAVKAGHLAIIQILLSDGRTVTAAAFSQSLHDAVRTNQLEIVRFLLATGHGFTERNLGLALRTAARWGYRDMVQLLISSGRVEYQVWIGCAIENAAAGGFHEIVRDLLPLTSGLFVRIYEVILMSAVRGWEDILAELLQRGPITMHLRDSCITHAFSNSVRDLMRMADVIADPLQTTEEPWDPGRLTLSFEDLKSRPAIWLFYVASRGMPSRIKFREYPSAVDLGGVMKQFITTLIESLIAKQVFLRTEDGLVSCTSAEDHDWLRQLGRVYSDLYRVNLTRSDKFLTGGLLHPRFLEFASISASLLEEGQQIKEAASLLAQIDPRQQILPLIFNAPDAKTLKDFREIMACDPGQEEAEAKAIVACHIRAAHAFFEGASSAFKAKILLNPIDALQAIQGERISKESLLAALRCERPTPGLLIKFRWIQERIQDADFKFCLKFLKAITGKGALAPGDKIKIKETWKDDPVYEIHTCFSSIDVPKVPLTRRDFLLGLEGCLDESYNIA